MAIDVVTKVSKAASGLCMFVHAMDVYSKASTSDETGGSPWVLGFRVWYGGVTWALRAQALPLQLHA